MVSEMPDGRRRFQRCQIRLNRGVQLDQLHDPRDGPRRQVHPPGQGGTTGNVTVLQLLLPFQGEGTRRRLEVSGRTYVRGIAFTTD